jgi:hypothetical protein
MMTCSLTLETLPETAMHGAVGKHARRDREFEILTVC